MKQTLISSLSLKLSFSIGFKRTTKYFRCWSAETVIHFAEVQIFPTRKCLECVDMSGPALPGAFCLFGWMNLQPHCFGCCIIYLGCGATWFAADLTIVLCNLLLGLLSATSFRHVWMWFLLSKEIAPLILSSTPPPSFPCYPMSQLPTKTWLMGWWLFGSSGKRHWL